MTYAIAVVVLGPLGAAMAALWAATQDRLPRLRDAITMLTLMVVTALSAWLLIVVERDGTVVLRVGNWDPHLGIVLVADLFAALVLLVATSTILMVECFAIGQRGTAAGAQPAVVAPVLLVLTAGVALAILTGDLFTLFVAFELILVSSYVLLTHQGRAGQVRSGMTYVVINLLASALFLVGVAFVYAATSTVNLALLAERIPDLPGEIQAGIGLWFLMVFGTKAAMFPLFSWLPDSYPTAPTTITAVFAGLLTKIGVYVLIRFHTLTAMEALSPIILVLAGLTMVVGVAGALAQDDVKRILSFHVVSQIGYMLMGLGLFSVAGVAGAILFLVHQIPVKTVLFLVGGLIEDDQGTSSLHRVSGLARRRPLLAVLFALPHAEPGGLAPVVGLCGQARPHRRRRGRRVGGDRGGRAGGQPADTAVDVEDLARGVLGSRSRQARRDGSTVQRGVAPHDAIGNGTGRRRDVGGGRVRRAAVGHERAGGDRSAATPPLHRGGATVIRMARLRQLIAYGLLLAAWCVLWGRVSVANVVSGLAVVAAVAAAHLGTGERSDRIRIVPLLRFAWLVAVDLVVSTVNVARGVLTPTDYTSEAIIAVPVPTETRSHLLLLVIAVTLTPGTAVVDADPDSGTLYLHLLHHERRAAVTAHVEELAALACRGLPSSTSSATIREPMP